MLAQITALLFLPIALATAQDTRHVAEPKIPAACVTLDAVIAAPHGVPAEADEHKPDTARIQQAMDHCAAGHAVVLRRAGDKTVFLSGPLTLRAGVTLVIDADTALVASRDARLFDTTPGSCGVVSAHGHGCKPLIFGDGAHDSGVMGEGSIDGRGGARVLGQDETWWDMAHRAKITDLNQNVPWLMILRQVDNFTLYKITLRNSPGFHVSLNDTDGFTAWGVKIMTPKWARNTDGIDPGSAKNITIAHCFIHTGDDDVAVKSSRGTPARNISILHNHFYTGHGMSIGSGTSGGVDHMLVEDLTIDGADNGLRVKSDRSRGGLVHDLTYRNVCIRNTGNPLVFTPLYTTFAGDQLPIYRDIHLEDVHITTAGSYVFLGLDAQHKLGLSMSNVVADDQEHSRFLNKDADLTLGPQRGNLEPKGENVNLSVAEGAKEGKPLDCSTRFVEFPSLPTAPEMAGKEPPEDTNMYVAADGTGEFYSIARALEAAPKDGALILIAPGVYREVLNIDKPNIQLRSIDPDPGKTVIVNDRNAGENGGTMNSATVNVRADNFFAENITIENDFNRTHQQVEKGSQALAVLVTGDRAIFHNVHLLGNQDTVFAGARHCKPEGVNCEVTRQYFYDSLITGNVDFLFGDSKAVFDHCELRSTAHQGGFITAQSRHNAGQDSGFVIANSKLTADPGVEGKVFLGRPWRPYARVVYLNTEMGAHIDPAGFREWHPGETHSLETVFYAEYGSTGPGAQKDQRDPHVRQLTAGEAQAYEPLEFLRGTDNWNPRTPPPAIK